MIASNHTSKRYSIDLHYVEAAGTGPPLVILHGLTGSHDEFLHLVPHLAQHAHVYLLDLRGHGLSAHVTDGYQIADYGRDVVAFLQQVVRQPAVLMGHSLGSLVATWLTAKMPHLVQGLLLEDPPFYIVQMLQQEGAHFYAYFLDLHNYLTRYHAAGGDLHELMAFVNGIPVVDTPSMLDAPASYASLFDASVLEATGADAGRARAGQLAQIDPAVLEPILSDMLYGAENPDDLLAQIRCPVHLMVADPAMGGAVPARDLARILAHLPHTTHQFFAGSGHDIHLDRPIALLDSVRRFLTERIDARAGAQPMP